MSGVDLPWPMYSVSQLHDLPEPTWLVDGHLTDGLTIMYGPSGAGKTFLALAWALSIATGAPWMGRDVLHAPVVYVSGEGGSGLGKRVSAWQSKAQQWQPHLYTIIGTVRLTVGTEVQALQRAVHATGARLLVVDTLARAMVGADENSAEDMGYVIQGLDWLRRTENCAALVVHHSGVEATRPRGSTALFGAADTTVRVDGEDAKLRVSCEKQKEAAPFAPWALKLRETVGSCVLEQDESRKRGFGAGA